MSIEEEMDGLFIKAFMFNPCPMAISEVCSGRYISVNDALVQTLGYPRTKVIGKTSQALGVFANHNDRNNAIQIMQDYGYLKNFETAIRCKNGSIIVGVFNAEYIQIKGKTFLLTVMSDVTARKQLEQEVIRLEKLNLIGELAGSISHEVRNPMTTVRGFLQVLAKKPEYLYHKEYFELMISELDRANSIISDFLAITKSDPANTRYVLQDLKVIIDELKPLIEADALERRNQLVYSITETPEIIINKKEIRQMVLNLVRNGFDAMPSSGNLTVKTFRKNNYVVLAVQDQGKGIDKSILDKLGTPFFTTKDNGTGLGLAVCYGIARRHNAKINIDTNSSGTTFLVQFPIP